MATTHLIKLMFCLKLLLILLFIFLIFKLILMFLQWKKHKVLMLPKLIFIIVCLVVGAKGYSAVHSIQASAQSHEENIIKDKNATKRLYERKGSKAVARKMGHHAEKSGTQLWDKSKNKYNALKNKYIKHQHKQQPHENQKQLQQVYKNNERKIQQKEQK